MDQNQDSQPVNELLEAVPERAQIDYMLRTTKQHQSLMFQLADQKASILTGLTMVMMTLSFGQLRTAGFVTSLAIFGITNAISAIIALTAVMPTLPRRAKAAEGLSFNPLFFGHASSVSEDEYVDRMAESMKKTEDVYETILRDLHQLSCVAERKFSRVRIAYLVLLVGFISAAVALVVEVALHNQWIRF